MILNDTKPILNREWSNNELKKFVGLFKGDIVNVSAWKDNDKSNCNYSYYFRGCKSYTITNFREDYRGFQGKKGEIELDLEKPLDSKMYGAFDTVFNHTTLEHVYDFQTAFKNLCYMTRDILILVLPWMQEYHPATDKSYGDYWRFSEEAIRKMCENREITPVYLSQNRDANNCIYFFLIASKRPELWWEKIKNVQDLLQQEKV